MEHILNENISLADKNSKTDHISRTGKAVRHRKVYDQQYRERKSISDIDATGSAGSSS